MNKDHNNKSGIKRTAGSDVASVRKTALPDFDTLRDMARHNPEELEHLRLALCQKVIDDAPASARQRLEGLMFHINTRRQLAKNNLDATRELSNMMNDSLARMQAMLKDLRTVQSESILLSTRKLKKDNREPTKATVLPFKR